MAVTYEEILNLFQETDRILKEHSLETDRKFQETNRQFQETARVFRVPGPGVDWD